MTRQQGDFDTVVTAARAELTANLATGHNMRSGVDTEGFDACVGPTLIDHEKRRAVVDSSPILEHIDREIPSSTRPSMVSAIIERANPMPPSPHVAGIETAAAA